MGSYRRHSSFVFEIPDLTTRSGLKKIHANFDSIYRRLDKARERYADNERIVGGVIVIYSKMCVDSILRNKLYERGMCCLDLRAKGKKPKPTLGLLDKIVPLVRTESSRYMALRALSTITHHGGAAIRKDIARQTTSALLHIINEFPDDKIIGELVITVLSHSAIYLVVRCTSLGGIIRLHRKNSEVDMRALDPMKFMACIQRGFPPPDLQERMMDYGLQNCDTFLTLSTSRDFQKAMMDSIKDRNMYHVLPWPQASRVYPPYRVFNCRGGIPVPGPQVWKIEVGDLELPFTRWVDALPSCARAMGGTPKEEDLANILDIKYHILKQRISDAVELARKDHVEGLRAAKKGLKCKHITPFVRFQLMQRAVEHAGDMGIRILQDSPAVGKVKWEEGIAFLMSPLDDAKVPVDEAPPDNRHMNAVLYWYILMTITISESLKPFSNSRPTVILSSWHALKTRKVADNFYRAIDIETPKTNLRLGQDTVVKYYTTAAADFGTVIAKASSEEDRLKTVSHEKLEDDLAAWLDDTHLDNEHDPELHDLHPKVNTNSAALYRCSHCGNPSAALRKCSGCSKARYCDSGCQRSHWPEHKKGCTSPQI
ncbi:hypothetical protein E4T56_gene10733 [Termitomyces sp. T112]|nr:hypothetical protein E4T56_gene10733 [Termitomyces sp. T112]